MKMSFKDIWSLSVRDDMLIVGHGKRIIKSLKKGLGIQFEFKDLVPRKKILGMRNICDIRKKNCHTTQVSYSIVSKSNSDISGM